MASQFQPLLNSITDSVNDKNWLAALALTLMLPDICASIETPKERVGQRYAAWWRKNFRASYRYGNRPRDHVKGEEVYLLRCAYLHEGSVLLNPIARKKVNATIAKFKFVTSNHHLQKERATVLLNARAFCLNMCSRVKQWEKNILSKNPCMQTRAEKLLKIYLLPSISAMVKTSADITPRRTRTCAKCGKTFPQEEHKSLCSDCR